MRDRLELLILATSRDALALADSDVQGFHSVQVVELGPIRSMSEARTTALRHATAPVVAYGEDHCYPDPDWAECLIDAHAQAYAAVGPTVRNANPRSLTSWVTYLMSYARWAEPVATGPTDGLPWHNTSYKRDLLLAYGADLPPLLCVEGLLQRDLVQRGHRLYLDPKAKVSHVNISLVSRALGHAYLGGRLFGALRARHEKWSPFRRLLYIGAAPLIPIVRLRRTYHEIHRIGEQHRLLPRALPALYVALSFHALGEAVGYAFGAGNDEQRYSVIELSRIEQITEDDRQAELAGAL